MKAVIVAAARTPIGSFNGAFSSLSAVQLGTQLLSGMLSQNPVLKSHIDEVILGQVLTAACGQNPARQTAIHAGLDLSVSAMTINKVCGSGLKAVQLAAQAVLHGDAEMVVAGGQESMSQAPHVLPASRQGQNMGPWALVDSMICDGLWDAFYDYHMGQTAEQMASRFAISRALQDEFAAHSQAKATLAQNQGRFVDEIIPMSVPQRRADPLTITKDEGIRPNTKMEQLACLRPAFTTNGTVTAGNASSINDGAAMVIVTTEKKAKQLNLPVLGVIEATACAGVPPEIMGTGPVAATQKVLSQSGWHVDELDLIEANEAFAVQALHVNRVLNFDPQKVNVNGGAIALGHPIGASGCRILVTLLHEMRRQKSTKGLATLCIGGGMGIAMLISRALSSHGV